MAKNLLDQAQIAFDDYNQSFAPANSFFTIEDFGIRMVDARDRMLDNDFLILFNARKQLIVNPQWSVHVFPEVKQDDEKNFYAEICEPIYEFPRDDFGFGIQDVSAFGSGCSEFVRITNSQAWSVCLTPSLPIALYSVEGCRILLYNFFGCTDKLNVRIIPSQSKLPLEHQTLPDGKASEIRQIVMAEMFAAYQQKLGKVSQHNDGNKNPAPNETDLIFDGLKTK